MRVLAIDPGNEKSAYIVWDGKTVLFKGHVSNEALRQKLIGNDRELVGCMVGACAIEMIASYGMAVGASVFDTCVWVGRFVELMKRGGWGDPQLVKRMEVKMHLCHMARAKDSNIRQALIDRFGAPGTKKNQGVTYGLSGDMWAAFALSVYVHDTVGVE